MNNIINLSIGEFTLLILLQSFSLFFSLAAKGEASNEALSETKGGVASNPNIVLIVSDYMGYADIGPYGAKDIKTPALDSLAEKGVKFSNHYAAAPTCIASRAALMSGQYPEKVLKRFDREKGLGLTGANNNLLIQLKDAGYKTALVGKWHLGLEKYFNPNDHGFDYFYGFNAWALGYHDHLTSEGNAGLLRNLKPINEEGYLTHLFSKEAVQFIDKNAKNPFFLYLSYNAGLPPYQSPDLPAAQWRKGWDANEASRNDYISMIEAMDQGIGSVLEKLNELNLDDDTLVIFTYDHGGRHLVDSGPLFHGFSTLWEGGIRVPLIIRWPNKVGEDLVHSNPSIAMDVTATMLDAAGRSDATTSLDGISLMKTMAVPDPSRFLFWRHGNMKAVRQGNWKYVVDGHTQLLFNLSADVSERDNRFFREPEKASLLRRALLNWEQSLRD